jgi:hypothetical protein
MKCPKIVGRTETLWWSIKSAPVIRPPAFGTRPTASRQPKCRNDSMGSKGSARPCQLAHQSDFPAISPGQRTRRAVRSPPPTVLVRGKHHRRWAVGAAHGVRWPRTFPYCQESLVSRLPVHCRRIGQSERKSKQSGYTDDCGVVLIRQQQSARSGGLVPRLNVKEKLSAYFGVLHIFDGLGPRARTPPACPAYPRAR